LLTDLDNKSVILGCTLLIAPKGEVGDAFGWLQGRKGPGVKFVVETVPERVHGESRALGRGSFRHRDAYKSV